MSLVINSNPAALNAANTLPSSCRQLSVSTRRLSSGLRIGNAAISLVQAADGALGAIDEKLIRMKELAEQAATGTYDSTQRLMIDSEYQAMASEITRIANATDFGGVHLLNDNLSGEANVKGLKASGALRIHFGTGNDSAEDYYDITIGTVTASALGLGSKVSGGGKTVSTQSAARAVLRAVENAIVSKDKIRASLGAMQNRLEATVSDLKIQAENLSAAESRISDVDVALEMSQFVRSQILAQTGVSMLAQANSMPRMALALIGGYPQPQG